MSAQDKTEQVLRDIHILLSQSEIYDRATNRVIVDKREVLNLLQRLNICIYEMMEEYELTKQSRAAAEREIRRKMEEVVLDANRTAEDVYAGAVMYTNEALQRIQDIVQDAADSLNGICVKMEDDLKKEKKTVRKDQYELQSLLGDLRDTNKYKRLIEDRNKEIAKEYAKAKKEEEEKPSTYAAVKPEIKVNTEYFEKAGIPFTEETEEETPEEMPEEKMENVTAEVKVNLDAEYFKWKEDSEEPEPEEKKPERHSRIGKRRKNN